MVTNGYGFFVTIAVYITLKRTVLLLQIYNNSMV